MNPTRKRRLWLVLAVVAAAAIATTLIAMALQRNVAYLYTPAEVLRGEAGDHQHRGGGTRHQAGRPLPGADHSTGGDDCAYQPTDEPADGHQRLAPKSRKRARYQQQAVRTHPGIT